jgi:hypothetical protein
VLNFCWGRIEWFGITCGATFGGWNLEFGIWNYLLTVDAACGGWNLAFGIWHLEFGIISLQSMLPAAVGIYF